MTEGQIWQLMLRKKVFNVGTLIVEYPPEIRGYIREKIKSLISGQLRLGLIKQVNTDPPVFALKDLSDEEIERFKRTCPICKRKFFPKQSVQEFCSKECRNKHYQNYHRRKRARQGMKVGSKRRWTKEEISQLKQLRELGYTYGEIAQRLGRTTLAVIEKYKQIKGVRK